MADLIKSFFEEDLSESQLDALERLLQKSPEEALRFEKKLGTYYARTGLPQPHFPKGHPASPKAGFNTKRWLGGIGGWLGLTVLAFAGTTLTTVKYWPQIKHFATTVFAPATAPLPEAKPLPPSPAPLPAEPKAVKPAPVLPAPVTHGAEGDALSVVVQAPQTTLVTVRILDPLFHEVRVLYVGLVQPGEWSFQWDGLLSDGKPAPAGDYFIDVRSGSSRQVKKIRLKSLQD